MALRVILITLTPTKTMDITDLPITMKIMAAGNHQIPVLVDF